MARKFSALEAQFVEENQCVKRFVEERVRRSKKTGRQYQFILYHYFLWLKKNKEFSNMSELLEDFREKKRTDEEFEHNEMVKEWLFSDEMLTKGLSYRKGSLSAIRSFYLFNRCPLPQEKIDLTVKEVDRQRLREKMARESKTMTLQDLELLISPMKAREKAIMLILLQSGMGIDEFTNQFNLCTCRREWLERNGHVCEPVKVMRQLSEGKRFIKVELMGRKKNPRPYFTYFGRDGVEMLKKYLQFRATLIRQAQKKLEEYEKREREGRQLNKWERKALESYRQKLVKLTPEWSPGEPIFLSNMLNPVKAHNIQIPVTQWKRNMGIENAFSPHAFRDIFRTECSHAGANKDIAEFFMGHTLDPLGYNKLDEMYPEDFEKEYSKVEPNLNIISHEGKLVSKEDMERLQRQNEFLGKEVEMLRNLVGPLIERLNQLEKEERDKQMQVLLKTREEEEIE